MLREPFFYIDRFGAVNDFGERLLIDVSECNLSAMVKAAGDNATVVENCYVRVKCTASAGDSFVSRL